MSTLKPEKIKDGGGGGEPALTAGNLESGDCFICMFFVAKIRLKLQLKDFLHLSLETSCQKPLESGRWVKEWAQIKMKT